MARPLRIDYPDAYYHVTCRGNERKDIFRDDQDRSVFLEKLHSSLEIYTTRLHAYVLMDNHFHLIVQTPKANLSEFMRHFNVSYTGFYNRRHNRTGHLYQGRFKAIVVDADSYLLELSRYVHLNPVRIGSLRRLGMREQLRRLHEYPWSSLVGYLSSAKRQPWVVHDEVLGYVGGSRKNYARFVEEGLEKGYPTLWENLRGQVLLGEEGFWQKVTGRWVKESGSSKEQPSLRVLLRIEPGEILNEAAAYFKLRYEDLTRKRGGCQDQRALVMELMHRYGGIKQEEIGRQLGNVDYTLVSRERKRLRENMERDSRLQKWYGDIEARLVARVKI
jgi:REP element-mobilizing transposase RayT